MQVSHGNSRSTSPHRGGSHARRRQVPQGRTRNVAGDFFAAEAARDLLAIFPLHVLLVEHHESPVGGHLKELIKMMALGLVFIIIDLVDQD